MSSDSTMAQPTTPARLASATSLQSQPLKDRYLVIIHSPSAIEVAGGGTTRAAKEKSHNSAHEQVIHVCELPREKYLPLQQKFRAGAMIDVWFDGEKRTAWLPWCATDEKTRVQLLHWRKSEERRERWELAVGDDFVRKREVRELVVVGGEGCAFQAGEEVRYAVRLGYVPGVVETTYKCGEPRRGEKGEGSGERWAPVRLIDLSHAQWRDLKAVTEGKTVMVWFGGKKRYAWWPTVLKEGVW